eukprot:8831286-Ditylum_brightwellii.AAC.1
MAHGNDQAEAVAEEVVSINNAGVICLEAGKLAEAARYFQHALALSNDTSRIALSRAQHNYLSDFSQIEIPSFSPDHKAANMAHIYQRGEYDEGMNTFSSPVRLEKNLGLGVDHLSAKVIVLYNMGQLHLRLNEDNSAAEFFYEALPLAQMSPNNSRGSSSLIAILHNLGHIQYRIGNHNEAMSTYASALTVA